MSIKLIDYNKDKYDLSCVSFTSIKLKVTEDVIISSIHEKLHALSIVYTFDSDKELWEGKWDKQVFTIDLYYDKENELSVVDLNTVKQKTTFFWKLFKEIKDTFHI